MGRPKGSKQKQRNEAKYWLPTGVILHPNHPDSYTQESKLLFIDVIYGEFISSYRALQLANASTHKLSVQKRREETNIIVYGGTNPSHSRVTREKAEATMVKRFGTRHALNNANLLKKSQDTLEANHGVRATMHSNELKNKQRQTFIDNYGVDNPMKIPSVVRAMEESYFAKTGYTNPGQNPASIIKGFETLTKNGTERSKSHGEREMLAFVQQFKPEAVTGFLGGSDPRELDIKISSMNLAIEYNGAYWHRESMRDYEKMLIAKKYGIKLLQFYDFEWLLRNKQVKSFLRSAVGGNEIKINGRQTIIKEVSKQEARTFLNEYHILGSPPGFKKAFGLYFKNELVSMITIGRHHRNKDELLLSRYVGKENISVRGGLSKLCKAAFSEFGEYSTFIDLRMSDGQSWLNNSWELVSTSKPDYFYYDPKIDKPVSKQSRQKKKIGTPDYMTESEHASLDGLHRLFDCGKLKLKYTGDKK